MEKKLIVGFAQEGNGWIAFAGEGNAEILDALYGMKTECAPKEKMIFGEGKTREEASEHVKSVALDMRFEAEAEGESLVVKSTQRSEKTIEFEAIDLKWSLWLSEKSAWEERAEKGVWEAMEQAFKGKAPRAKIYTAPRKEIRFGNVEFEKGQADVDFYCLWDSPFDLVPGDCPKNLRKRIQEEIEEYFEYEMHEGEYPIGAQVQRIVKAESFESLMEQIDALENELLEQEKEHSEQFHGWLDARFEELKNA